MEVKKDSNEIIISEYDWEKDEETEVVYSVHPDVKIENADSWKDIPNGTYIDIEYVTDKNGKRIINYISTYEIEAPESEME